LGRFPIIANKDYGSFARRRRCSWLKVETVFHESIIPVMTVDEAAAPVRARCAVRGDAIGTVPVRI
jgi:hypothetical protein